METDWDEDKPDPQASPLDSCLHASHRIGRTKTLVLPCSGGISVKIPTENIYGEVEDVLSVVCHAQQEFGHLPLILSGFSFGGYVQARAAQHLHPQPHRLVLIAPAVGRFEMPLVPHNTLLIHGEQDEVVSLADVMDWARPQHLPIVVLPEAGHFFHGRLHQLKQLVLQDFHGQRL